MRAIAYSIRSSEKEPLALANVRRHLITLITNPLTLATADFAEGKEAVIVSSCDELTGEVVDRLVDLGVRYILIKGSKAYSTASPILSRTDKPLQVIDLSFLFHQNNLKEDLIDEQVALHIVYSLNRWEEGKCEEISYPAAYSHTSNEIRRSA
ncbi:hypothetical protein [Desertivirga brevis]|uniref:hypothetical protein n=1 Tax=Desertivirga brevis TaxID=2810310 RepID=UPI001A973DFA|nr:hypothetical protein [Pedobacter sp. SYSU D00873]